MESYLKKFIISLNKRERQQFKRLFQMKSRKQDFIVLFDLFKENIGEDQSLAHHFGSSDNFSRVKAELAEKLFQFIAIYKEDASIIWTRYKKSWEFFYENNHFGLAARAIKVASKLVVKNQMFDKIVSPRPTHLVNFTFPSGPSFGATIPPPG